MSNLNLISLFTACLLLHAAPANAAEEREPVETNFQDRPALRNDQQREGGPGAVQIPQIERFDDRTVAVSLVIDGVAERMILEPHSVRAPRFQVLVHGRHGQLVSLEPLPEPNTYRGRFEGHADAIVAASIVGDRVRAIIVMPDRTARYVEPLAAKDAGDGDEGGRHIVYDGRDVAPMPGRCGGGVRPFEHQVEDDEMRAILEQIEQIGPIAEPETPPTAPLSHGSGMPFNVLVAFDADFPYYQSNNSSVLDTIDDIETIMNAVNVVYERDTLITHHLGAIVIRTSAQADPYDGITDADALLAQMRSHWNSNHTNIQRDVAHLFTGQDLDCEPDDCVIGQAYLDSVCAPLSGLFALGYGFSWITFFDNSSNPLFLKTGLVAHELGHNWSATHCNVSPASSPCNIMCTNINDCDGLGAPQFGPAAMEAILTYATNNDCTGGPSVKWVDFNHTGLFEFGTFANPYKTLSAGVVNVPTGGHVIIKSSTSDETITIMLPRTINTWNGTSTVGQ